MYYYIVCQINLAGDPANDLVEKIVPGSESESGVDAWCGAARFMGAKEFRLAKMECEVGFGPSVFCLIYVIDQPPASYTKPTD